LCFSAAVVVGTKTPSALTYTRVVSGPAGVATRQSPAVQSNSNCSSSDADSTAFPSLSTTCRSISSDMTISDAALRFATLRAKLRPAIPSRQHNSLKPTLTVANAASNSRSSGLSLPSPDAYHLCRNTSIRPLTLRLLRRERPLLRLTLPALSTGGGKTRLRGVDPHLHRLFKNPSLQLHHRVADLHLRPVDHVPIRRIVHRVGNLTKSPPGFLQHLGYELILVHRQKPIHGMLLIRLPAGKTPLYPPPEFLGTPGSIISMRQLDEALAG
jgi:hypothetical protein